MTEIDVTFRRNSDNTTIQLLQHKLSNMLSNCYISCVFDLCEEMSQKKAIVRNVKQKEGGMYVIAISLGQDEHEIARPQSQRAFERRMNVKYPTKRPK